jgi:GNAT superfamily N-acetyltransferase
VSLASALQLVFGTQARFAPAASRVLPAGIRIREFRSSDREGCLRIYRENEPGRFPTGVVPWFENFLARQDYLKLVCSTGDEPVAVGGIGAIHGLLALQAWLVFGLVAPSYHRQGIGTTLLLARLAALPRPGTPVRLLLSNVAGSVSFFARFGFELQGQMAVPPTGQRVDVCSAVLDAAAWGACRRLVSDVGMDFDTLQVPQIDMDARSPNNRWRGP